jgi:K+-sensing histidine kinase KdpD
MCKALIEKLNGTIKFERNYDGGCNFTFSVEAFDASQDLEMIGDDFEIEIVDENAQQE